MWMKDISLAYEKKRAEIWKGRDPYDMEASKKWLLKN